MGHPIDAVVGALNKDADFVETAAGDGKSMFEAAVASAKTMSLSDVGHLILDGAGMVPVVGEIADVANGLWYAAEGNTVDAALAMGSAIPFAGNAVTAAKWGKRAVDAADAVADVSRLVVTADNASDVRRLANEAADLGAAGRRADAPGAAHGKPDDADPRVNGLRLTTVNRTQGANTMEWQVDDQGRFVSGRATLNEDFAGRKTRSSAEVRAQREAADRGIEGDQGGHMFAHRFVKDQGSINLVPQNGDLNNRAWGQMEQEWGDWIASGKRVEVQIDATPAGQDRPEAFRVLYEVVDPASGKTVYSNTQLFENEAGQVFDRVPARDIRS
jgi:hypothetical protein